MRICFLLGGFSNYGGIGRATAVLASHLSADPELEIFALCLYRPESRSGYDIAPAVHVDYLFEAPLTIKRAFLRGGLRKLTSYILKNRIDILIACGTLYYPMAVMAGRRTGARSILWEHTHPNSRNDHFLQDESRAYGARRSDCNVVIAARALEIYRARFPRARNRLIHNPLDPAAGCRLTPYGEEHKRILSVGRLSYPKNYDRLIRLAGPVLAGHDDWRWDIYGEGELRAELEEAIRRENLEGRVCLMGQCDRVYEVYRNYDFLVMTSRLEGFPMVLLEASANLLPLLAFDVETGPSEVIRDGENGYLVPASDDEGMIRAIRTLMENPALRSAFSAESGRTAADFSVERIGREWKALFEELAAGKGEHA